MKWSEMSASFSATTGLGRIFQIFLALMVIVNIGFSFKLMGNEKAPRTILVPSHITQSFWIDDSEVAPEYLAQMGQFLLGLWINASPQSVDYQITEFKRYVNPSYRGAMNEIAQRYSDGIKKNQSSSVFYPNQAVPDAKNNRVLFRGMQRVWVGKALVKEENLNYLLQFRFNAGQITLTGFCQTTNDDLFADKKPEKCSQ